MDACSGEYSNNHTRNSESYMTPLPVVLRNARVFYLVWSIVWRVLFWKSRAALQILMLRSRLILQGLPLSTVLTLQKPILKIALILTLILALLLDLKLPISLIR